MRMVLQCLLQTFSNDSFLMTVCYGRISLRRLELPLGGTTPVTDPADFLTFLDSLLEICARTTYINFVAVCCRLQESYSKKVPSC